MENQAEFIFEELINEYSSSDVTSGEMIYSTKIPITFDESVVRKGIQMFLDWDESEETFELKKNRKYWKIICI
jgi:predicted RNA-binding protein with PUA domain